MTQSSFYGGATVYTTLPSLTATSTDSITIGTGDRTFNIQGGKAFAAGMYIQAIETSNNANWIFGQVVSYTGTVLVLNGTLTSGTGTFTDWTLQLTGGPQGAQGIQGIQGIQGVTGASYAATSTTSLANANTGSKAFTTQAGLAYLSGARARATSAGTGHWMEGVVSSYSGTTLTITMDNSDGDTGTYADWNINLNGQPGQNGGGVSGQTNHRVVVASGATTLGAGVALGANQLLVGAAGADPVAATVSGDLTNSVGVFTIANAAVTYAKIQNVSATNRFLGRITAGAGSTEELTGANAVTIIGGNLSTLQSPGNWKAVYTDGSGVLQTFALGAANTSLVGNGTTSAPSFVAWSTAGQYQGNSTNALLSTNNVWTAAGLTTLTDGATVTPDFSTGFDFIWTLGAAGRTLANPTNTKVGQKGLIYLVQDATGSRTITTWGTNYKFGGSQKPTLTTTASAVDILSYVVKSATEIHCFVANNMG
jgi:hypothetical protein